MKKIITLTIGACLLSTPLFAGEKSHKGLQLDQFPYVDSTGLPCRAPVLKNNKGEIEVYLSPTCDWPHFDAVTIAKQKADQAAKELEEAKKLEAAKKQGKK